MAGEIKINHAAKLPVSEEYIVREQIGMDGTGWQMQWPLCSDLVCQMQHVLMFAAAVVAASQQLNPGRTVHAICTLKRKVRHGAVHQRHEIAPQFQLWGSAALPWLPNLPAIPQVTPQEMMRAGQA